MFGILLTRTQDSFRILEFRSLPHSYSSFHAFAPRNDQPVVYFASLSILMCQSITTLPLVISQRPLSDNLLLDHMYWDFGVAFEVVLAHGDGMEMQSTLRFPNTTDIFLDFLVLYLG